MKRIVRNDDTKIIKLFIIITVILMIILVSISSVIILREISKISVNEPIDSSSTELTFNDDILVKLINADNPIPADFKLNLVDFMGIKCNEIIVADLNKLIEDGKKEGFNFSLTKGYVDKDTQQAEYDKKVAELIESGISKVKAMAEVLKTVQPGNCSEYQTGLSVDITKTGLTQEEDFSQTKEFNWLYSNCVNYGFILRYPQDKVDKTGAYFNPNTFRYVGIENAKKMRVFNMCLDEYAAYINEQKN